MRFSIPKHYTERAKTISACFNFMSRQGRTPHVQEHQLRCPHDINKMPIKYRKIKSNCFRRSCGGQYHIAHCLINCPNKNMKTVKTSSQVKSTPINCVTKSETCRSVFYILTVHKKCTLSNCYLQISSTQTFFIVVQRMFRCICSKVRCLQNQGVCFGLTRPMQRHNTYRRPCHTNLNSRHQSSMHKCPLQTNKKDCFTNNKKKHSKLLSSCNFSSMAIQYSFTSYITPPLTCSISKARQCQSLNCTCTRILMKKKNQRNSQPQDTKSSLGRPWTWIYDMVSMMRPRINSCLHFFLLSKKNISCIFIFNKKSHCLIKIKKQLGGSFGTTLKVQ